MYHFARRGVAALAAGTLALGLAACAGPGESPSGEAASAEVPPPGLDCDDLAEQVNANAPDATSPISEFEAESLEALTAWMVEKGPDFEDAELGTAVAAFGEVAAAALAHEAGDGEASQEQLDQYESSNTLIGEQCPDIGFGFEEEPAE
ncbi:MAG: hypothetical protein ACRDXX_14140 [Stackebrandtia sp.]